jgi:hypothetical protein
VIADDARLLGAGDDRAEELAGREAVLDFEAVRDDVGGAEVVGEDVHQEVERARDEDHVVARSRLAFTKSFAAWVDARLDDRVEGLVREGEEAVFARRPRTMRTASR